MSKEGSLHRHLMVNRRDLASALLVVIAWTWIEFWLRRNADGFSNDLCALTLLLLFLVFWMSYRRSSRSDILWPSESRLDPEKIDLKFEVAWSNRRLSEFGGFLSGLSGKSSMYLTRMVVSKESGLELHYKETLNGLDEVVHLELGQVSAVHHWTRRFRNEDGPDTTHDSFAIIADSVIHKLPKLEEPQPWEPDWDADVPEKIRKLCDILELSLKETKPWGTDFLEMSKKEIMGPKQDGRIVDVILGAVLFFFGLPFTLTPYFFYQLGEFNSDDTFMLLFNIAFTIPFMMFGLFIQSVGLGMMRGNAPRL